MTMERLSRLKCPCCRSKIQVIYSNEVEYSFIDVKCPSKECGWKHKITKGFTLEQRDIDYIHLMEKEKHVGDTRRLI